LFKLLTQAIEETVGEEKVLKGGGKCWLRPGIPLTDEDKRWRRANEELGLIKKKTLNTGGMKKNATLCY